jgi:hypothetical protein
VPACATRADAARRWRFHEIRKSTRPRKT